MEKFTILNNTAIRYSDFGKGEKVIVLLHGYLESIEVFEKFAGILGKHLRVICVDLPGHGFSQWQDREVIDVDFSADIVAELIKKLNLSNIYVLGHSMGGYVAVSVAQRYSDLVSGLILFSSSPAGDSDERRENREREIKLIEAGKKEMLSAINPGKGFAPMNHRRMANEIDELSEQMMIMDDEAIVATLKGLMRREDRSEFFAKTSMPRLMIFGKHDAYIPQEIAQSMIEKYPTAKHVWLENSGHNGFLEQPDESAQAILEFIG